MLLMAIVAVSAVLASSILFVLVSELDARGSLKEGEIRWQRK
jgi:hypothetical protein